LYRILDFISRIDKFGRIHLKINLYDQIEVLAVKAMKLDYLVSSALEKKKKRIKKDMRVFVVLPAYNAEKTLKRTVDDIPKDVVDRIILVDDKSKDRTVEIAKSLGLEVFQHEKNMGYGANQKTCYKKALEEGADIVVMVHPDYQYDPAIIPELIEPIQRGRADAVFGSRMMKGGALEGGMPLWKHNANILLTAFENVILGTYLTEYHSGFRAYSADLLKTINFELNSNKFVFDTEIIVQSLIHHFKIVEVPIQTRYFNEASKMTFLSGIPYGLGIIWTMIKYILHVKGIYKFRQFE
jgi:glycosyltransferase involved in cell wall biosynthesis